MQGKKHYQDRLFSTVNLAAMIPQSHVLVRLDRVLDLSFIYELTKGLYCVDNGRPSIDPVLFFRMQLIGYLFGIRSDRQLCEEVHLNIAYRWFCRLNLEDEVPDHSSLTRIRDRLGVKTYQAVFEGILGELRRRGFLKGKRLVVDASIVAADASMDSLVGREDGDPQARELKPYQERYHDFKTGKKKRKVSNQTHVSQTDPDATIVSRRSQHSKLSYKAHYSIDGDSRFIVDCHATTGARHECTVLPERLQYLHDEVELPIEEVIADKGYGRGPTYRFLRERGIRAYIPLHDEHLGEGRISRGQFKYDRRADRFVCPHGTFLYPYEKRERGLKRYRAVGGYCSHCPLRETRLPGRYKKRTRFVYRSPDQDEIDRIKQRQKTRYFKKKLAERRWKIEGLFGEAKERHCLRRARYRSLVKVQIQLYLTAIVQNLKRLVSRLLDFLRHLFYLSARFDHQTALWPPKGQARRLFVIELRICP